MESSKQSPQPSSNDQEAAEETQYQQKISTLPRYLSWITPAEGKLGNYYLYQYQGFWYTSLFLRGILKLGDSFKEAKPSNIIVSSHPKTGTTWLKALSYAICTRKQFPADSPLLNSLPHDLIPLIEFGLAKNRQHDETLPLLSTHLPYSTLPKPIIDSGCKIVYIWRDPKAVFVSLWHFNRKMTMKWYEDIEPISLEKAFDMFCQGKENFGPYWDHVLGYWNASLNRPDEILFLKYEDMKMDPTPYVKKLAEFMGFPFNKEEEKEGQVERIIRMCSFDNLSNLEVNKRENYCGELAMDNSMFFRKAKDEDWENYLTNDMAQKVDQITSEKFHGSGLEL